MMNLVGEEKESVGYRRNALVSSYHLAAIDSSDSVATIIFVVNDQTGQSEETVVEACNLP